MSDVELKMEQLVQSISIEPASIAVFGDIMLDHYIYGTVERISPEAPVPIVLCNKETDTLGGCGNVLRNLSALGLDSNVFSFIGDDRTGDTIKYKLDEVGVNTEGLMVVNNYRSTHKTRIIGGMQQIVRVDWEEGCENVNNKFEISNFFKTLKTMSGVIISDYGKGVCSYKNTRLVIDYCTKNSIPVFVDPKGNNWEKYKGATFITPNTKEVELILGEKLKNESDFKTAGKYICEKYSIKFCLITRGKEGVSFIDANEYFHVESTAVEVYDVSGAGDTVISCLCAAIASGVDLKDAIEFANYCAGIVVGYVGTRAINKSDLVKK